MIDPHQSIKAQFRLQDAADNALLYFWTKKDYHKAKMLTAFRSAADILGFDLVERPTAHDGRATPPGDDDGFAVDPHDRSIGLTAAAIGEGKP